MCRLNQSKLDEPDNIRRASRVKSRRGKSMSGATPMATSRIFGPIGDLRSRIDAVGCHALDFAADDEAKKALGAVFGYEPGKVFTRVKRRCEATLKLNLAVAPVR